jgi:voltage-gated potassium channel
MLGGEGHNDIWVKAIDGALIALIVLNILAVILESVPTLSISHGPVFHLFDLVSVGVFSIEYVLRVWTAVELPDQRFKHPLWGRLRYMTTPLAIVDLLAVLPFFLGYFVEFDLRTLRVLRLLRIFKLTRYSSAMHMLVAVLRQESRAVGAILFIMVVMMVFMGSLMYLIEHPVQPHVFPDIPTAMWWAIVTLTTLGYGDVTPVTPLGRMLGGVVAVAGVAMVALPSGILASGFSEQLRIRREEYSEKVAEAISDGRLSKAERHALEEMRQRLGLSQDEAASILEHISKQPKDTNCPHCGVVLKGFVVYKRRREDVKPAASHDPDIEPRIEG